MSIKTLVVFVVLAFGLAACASLPEGRKAEQKCLPGQDQKKAAECVDSETKTEPEGIDRVRSYWGERPSRFN